MINSASITSQSPSGNDPSKTLESIYDSREYSFSSKIASFPSAHSQSDMSDISTFRSSTSSQHIFTSFSETNKNIITSQSASQTNGDDEISIDISYVFSIASFTSIHYQSNDAGDISSHPSVAGAVSVISSVPLSSEVTLFLSSPHSFQIIKESSSILPTFRTQTPYFSSISSQTGIQSSEVEPSITYFDSINALSIINTYSMIYHQGYDSTTSLSSDQNTSWSTVSESREIISSTSNKDVNSADNDKTTETYYEESISTLSDSAANNSSETTSNRLGTSDTSEDSSKSFNPSSSSDATAFASSTSSDIDVSNIVSPTPAQANDSSSSPGSEDETAIFSISKSTSSTILHPSPLSMNTISLDTYLESSRISNDMISSDNTSLPDLPNISETSFSTLSAVVHHSTSPLTTATEISTAMESVTTISIQATQIPLYLQIQLSRKTLAAVYLFFLLRQLKFPRAVET